MSDRVQTHAPAREDSASDRPGSERPSTEAMNLLGLRRTAGNRAVAAAAASGELWEMARARSVRAVQRADGRDQARS